MFDWRNLKKKKKEKEKKKYLKTFELLDRCLFWLRNPTP